jgi:hypothetical protein
MAFGRAETCRWKKQCKNILLTKNIKQVVWLHRGGKSWFAFVRMEKDMQVMIITTAKIDKS